MEPNEILALVAMAGALWYMVQGYWTNRINDPDTKFDPAYLTQTLIAMLVSGFAFHEVSVEKVDLFSVIAALLMGMGGNSVVSKAKRVTFRDKM
ncbi:MAG: hypothetical protein QCH31_04975 [Methanolobus sp.]|nr:hypothetical protein [Methanolobus sp.]